MTEARTGLGPAESPRSGLRPFARPLVYGHRGMRGLPENTLPAFEKALAVGADGIELDVRVCKSGEVVVMHDPELKRMAGRDERVAELDYAALARIDLGGGAHAPLLAQALALALRAPHEKGVNVEIKGDVPDLAVVVRGVARELAQLSQPERARVVVSSFEAAALTQLRALDATIALGFLYSDANERAQAPRGLSAFGEHPRHTLLDAAQMRAIRAGGASFVNTWTVNDPARAVALAQLGVDAIISDLPDVVLAALPAR